MIDFIQQFGLLFLVVVAISFAIKLLRQPIIIGYVLSGIIFSLYLADGSFQREQIIALSELGITFLLFLMGIEFDLKSLKYLGKDILITTSLQSITFFALGYIIGILFGFPPLTAVYLAILFMFSSTLLVAKWLEDKKENTALHGKITLGTLIIQDLFAIIALTILSVLQESSWVAIVAAPFKGLLLIALGGLLARYVLNKPLQFCSRYPELLFIFSLGICFLFTQIAPYLGYSATIGAFIAGVTLANTIYKNDILARLKPLIIFFNMLFFVGLGFQMNFKLGWNTIFLILTFTVLGFIMKPLVTYITLKMQGYDLKTSYMSSSYLAQFSEFGIIIIAQGVFSKVINQELNTIAIITVIMSMILSSYVIKYDQKLYLWFEKWLKRIDFFFRKKEVTLPVVTTSANIIFFGYYDLSKELYSKLEGMGKKLLVIENDPENIEMLKKDNIPYVYNSVSNPEFFEHFQGKEVELVVSSLMDINENKLIIEQMKNRNSNTVIIVTAKNVSDSLTLYDANADYVIYPMSLNEQQVSVLLEDYTTDISKVIHKKILEIARLKERDEKRRATLGENKFLDIDSFMNTLFHDAPSRIKDISKKPLQKMTSVGGVLAKKPLQKMTAVSEALTKRRK